MSENIEIYSNEMTGLPISHAWRGHGSAIFIEIGTLTKEERRNHPIGEYSVMLDCDWRIEGSSEIQCGSFCESEIIDHSISELVGDSIASVELMGVLPEVTLILTSGKRVLSFTSDTGQPEWAIFLPDKSWLASKKGSLVREKA